MSRPRGAIATRIERTGDAQADRVQQSSADVAALLRLCPFLRGRLISATFTAATPKTIVHGLGVPAAAFVIRGVSGYPLLAETTQVGDPRQQLTLIADLDCTVDLWFYARASRPIDPRSGVST